MLVEPQVSGYLALTSGVATDSACESACAATIDFLQMEPFFYLLPGVSTKRAWSFQCPICRVFAERAVFHGQCPQATRSVDVSDLLQDQAGKLGLDSPPAGNELQRTSPSDLVVGCFCWARTGVPSWDEPFFVAFQATCTNPFLFLRGRESFLTV